MSENTGIGSTVLVTDPDSPLYRQTGTVIEMRDETAPPDIREMHPGVVSLVLRKVRNMFGEAWVRGVAPYLQQE